MAENCHDNIEGWEWDSVFASSFFDHDSHSPAWHSDDLTGHPLSGRTDEVSKGSLLPFPSPPLQVNLPSEALLQQTIVISSITEDIPVSRNVSDGSPVSSEYDPQTPGSTHHFPSNVSLNRPTVVSRKKKRDPRLECPNFLAGRVPCSCPEVDEAEAEVEETVRKKRKAAARCQVPSCGGDISHLKGYHQRHRVCLDCANSPKVILKDQAQRYCQQCGKFHRLSDFDEGKRSCRRKLERHNKRRRRRPLVTGEGAEEQPISVPTTNDKDISDEGCPVDANSALEEFKTTASIEQRSDVLMSHTGHSNEGVCSVKGVVNEAAEGPHGSDDSMASPMRGETEFLSSSKSGLDEQSLMAMLMDDSTEEMGNFPSVRNMKKSSSRSQEQRSKSTDQQRHAGYVSPCPSGRVSFKLYDWNPADFPRRLRQQIFEWLGNMPVELEGFIRSGCIILTFFMTMPQALWDKMTEDWIEHVQRFFLGPRIEIWGTGQVIACVNDKSMCIKNGEILSADYKAQLAPVLVNVHPRCLEAGTATHIYISGFHLQGQNSRFLFSFGEQCMECRGCEPVANSLSPLRTGAGRKFQLETWRVAVVLSDWRSFGPAYVEVDTEHGVSNVIPVLVADKSVCIEINSLISLSEALTVHLEDNSVLSSPEKEAFMGQQSVTDLLIDLGWVLRYIQDHQLSRQEKVRKALKKRLMGLFLLCFEQCLEITTERLISMALATGLIQHLPNRSVIKTARVLTASPYLETGVQPCSNMLCFLQGLGHTRYSKESHVSLEVQKEISSLFSSNLKMCEPDTSCPWASWHQEKSYSRKRLFLPSTGSQPTKGGTSPFLQSTTEWNVEVPLLEKQVIVTEMGLQNPRRCSFSSMDWLPKLKYNFTYEYPHSTKRRFWRIAITAVSVITLCGGMCFMFQHPHEVAQISMSLRRCLWN